jgi:outer membrane protein
MKKSLICLLSVVPAIALAQSGGFVGDVGGLVATSQAIVKGADNSTTALPYVYGDWGRFYARVDTLGVKMLPLGDGHIELAMRVSTEGFQSSKTAYTAAGDRSAPLPIGLGTFQRTALGGVFAYAMHDPQSGGQFGELNWAGKLNVGPVKLYPQLGVQYRSADYVRHLYGIDAAQAQATGLSVYRPGASFTPMATLQATVPLNGPWALQLQTRYRRLDDAVAHSPLVNRSSQVSGFAAVTYTLN